MHDDWLILFKLFYLYRDSQAHLLLAVYPHMLPWSNLTILPFSWKLSILRDDKIHISFTIDSVHYHFECITSRLVLPYLNFVNKKAIVSRLLNYVGRFLNWIKNKRSCKLNSKSIIIFREKRFKIIKIIIFMWFY